MVLWYLSSAVVFGITVGTIAHNKQNPKPSPNLETIATKNQKPLEAQSLIQTTISTDWKIYTNTTYNYSLNIPQDTEIIREENNLAGSGLRLPSF